MMQASGFIAHRIRFKGRLATTAIAVSFLIIIIAEAVSAGFRKEIRSAVASLGADISLEYGESFLATQSYLPSIEGMEGVDSITPVIYRAGIIKTATDIQGVVFKGVPCADSTLQARIPSKLAKMLDLEEGDAFLAYFVQDKVKARKFRVKGIYPSLIDTQENLIVYVPISDLRRVSGWEESRVSALEVTLDESLREREKMRRKASEIEDLALHRCGDDDDFVMAVPACRKYAQIFDWLDLIDVNVRAILLLMIVVAGFNMISGLLILLLEHISTIGTLKTAGMSNRGIAEVFLRVSARAVLVGMAAGNAAAFLICAVQHKTNLLRLNPENYFVSFVPVSVEPAAVICADVAAVCGIMLLLLIPCLFISKVDPSRTVRTE